MCWTGVSFDIRYAHSHKQKCFIFIFVRVLIKSPLYVCSYVLFPGKEKTERRRYLEAVIERDPTGVFSNEDNHYLHRTDRHIRGVAKGVRLIEICRKLGIGDECGGRITESKDFQVILEGVADDIPLGT